MKMSVAPSYDANFKWHMPICVERCRVDYKCHFWDYHRARFPKKKSKAQKHIQMAQRCALDFFREKRSVTVPRFEFFPKIHG